MLLVAKYTPRKNLERTSDCVTAPSDCTPSVPSAPAPSAGWSGLAAAQLFIGQLAGLQPSSDCVDLHGS